MFAIYSRDSTVSDYIIVLCIIIVRVTRDCDVGLKHEVATNCLIDVGGTAGENFTQFFNFFYTYKVQNVATGSEEKNPGYNQYVER